MEQSAQAGALPERVRELGAWLAAEREPGLTRSFDLWLGVLGRKWGLRLPSIRDYEEASAVLANKIDRWGTEILEQGIEQGIERGLLDSIREALELRFERGAADAVAGRLEAGGGDLERLKQLLRAAVQPYRRPLWTRSGACWRPPTDPTATAAASVHSEWYRAVARTAYPPGPWRGRMPIRGFAGQFLRGGGQSARQAPFETNPSGSGTARPGRVNP